VSLCHDLLRLVLYVADCPPRAVVTCGGEAAKGTGFDGREVMALHVKD